MTSPFPSLRKLVIRPTLEYLGLYSPAAENLLWGTAVQESGLRHLEQIGGGPALGLWQIEPATQDDLYMNWLNYRLDWLKRLADFAARYPSLEEQLVTNLAYSCAVARLIYYRRPEPLPEADDIEGLAAYWKQHYNTSAGKGKAEDWVINYFKYQL